MADRGWYYDHLREQARLLHAARLMGLAPHICQAIYKAEAIPIGLQNIPSR